MALLPDTNISENGFTIDAAVQEVNTTYKMRIAEETVQGSITDNLKAVEQAVYKILNTERYKHVIYSWDYGVELADLFGKPIPWVLSEIPRRIKEALVQDDRIEDVTDFDLSYTRDNSKGQRGDVLCKFTVQTIYGEFTTQKGVSI